MMDYVWKRLNDDSKNYRIIYKVEKHTVGFDFLNLWVDPVGDRLSDQGRFGALH